MQSPAHTTYNYSSNPSHPLSSPYPASVCTNLHRGFKPSPQPLSNRFHSDATPQPLGTYPSSYYPSGAPPMQYHIQSPIPQESHSGSRPNSTDMSSHIYQSIEAPPLPPPRSRNIYVPRPQSTPSGLTSSQLANKVPGSNDVFDSGYASQSRSYEPGGIDLQDSRKSGRTNALNETFTIEPVDNSRSKVSPQRYHHSLRPTSAPGGVHGNIAPGKPNPPFHHPPLPSSSLAPHSNLRHHQHIQGVERKLPSYLQMTKSAASKRVPR